MNSERDVRRSLAHHVSLALPTWDVYPATPLGETELPFVIITSVGDMLTANRGWHTADMVQPYSIQAHPVPDEDEFRSSDRARNTLEALRRCLLYGEPAGAPRRIPLYDYDDLDVDESLPSGRTPTGMIRVDDLTLRDSPDDVQNRVWVISGTLRAAWSGHIAVAHNPLVTTVHVQPQDLA
jgi:hypothetical protein